MPPVELNVLGDKLSGYIWWQMLEAFLRKRYPQIEPHEFRSAEPEEVGQMLSRRVAWIPDPGRSSTPPQTLNEFLLNINLFKQPHSSETRSLRAQVDTGAAPLFMNLTKAEELGFKLEPYYDKEIIAVNDKPIEIFSTTRQAWYPEGGRQVMWDDFLVVKDLPFDVVVGRERWHEVKGHLSGGVLAEAERKGFRLGWLIGCLFICLVLIYVPRSWLLALAHKILPGGMRHAPSTDMMAFLIAATLFVEACLCPFLQRPELGECVRDYIVMIADFCSVRCTFDPKIWPTKVWLPAIAVQPLHTTNCHDSRDSNALQNFFVPYTIY